MSSISSRIISILLCVTLMFGVTVNAVAFVQNDSIDDEHPALGACLSLCRTIQHK